MVKYKRYVRFEIPKGNKKEKMHNMKINGAYFIFTCVAVVFVLLCFSTGFYGESIYFWINRRCSDSSIIYLIFSVFFLLAFIKFSSFWFSKIIFRWKSGFLRQYYQRLDEEVGDMEVNQDQREETLVFVPSGPNGGMIGLLESFLYAGAFFARSMAFIGIVLAVRSYVAVSSHPNKEESEFYIMGVMGSLLYSLSFAFLFAWISAYCFNITYFEWIKG